MTIPLFAQIVATQTYSPPAGTAHGPLPWKNTNTMLKSYPGTIGGKTGWTGAAGGCLVVVVKRDGHTLISIILNSPNETTRFTDSKALLNWGFSLSTQTPQV
jgi:D-alanyl-D-alanine carboxypeptidase (penicillin-binding protein 5/6)